MPDARDPRPSSGSWWKPTADTVAAYLSLDESTRLLAGSASLAPRDWQNRATKTLGERLGGALKNLARGGLSVATLGLSEIMYRLAQPGDLAGSPSLPPLDLVVGPTEAAVLIVDGAVELILNSERASTHQFWDQLDRMIARGPHLEVVMLDLAPFQLTIPAGLVIGAEEVRSQVDVEVALSLPDIDRVLNLLSRSRSALGESSLNQTVPNPDAASFATSSSVATTLQRRLEHKASAMTFARADAARLRTDGAVLAAAEREVTQFLTAELGRFGMQVQRCHLLVGRTGEETLAIDRRAREIEQARLNAAAETDRLNARRQQQLTEEHNRIAQEQTRARVGDEGALAELREGQRFGLARMVMLNDEQIARIGREGFERRRESERSQAVLDFHHDQLLLRERHAAELEHQLASAKNGAEVQRISLQLERERLAIAGLAQEQNLLNLKRLKEIEREDDLLRDRDAAEREKARLTVAGALSPEQMMAALADRSPEIARALAAKFAADGALAQKSAEEKVQLMREMQAELANTMRLGLQANADVARGLVAGSHDRPQVVGVHVDRGASAIVPPSVAGPQETCSSCKSAVQPQWRMCPYCGKALTR